MRKLTLYGKPDCPLCDKMKDVVERVRGVVPFGLEVISIETDAALFDRFWKDSQWDGFYSTVVPAQWSSRRVLPIGLAWRVLERSPYAEWAGPFNHHSAEASDSSWAN